MIKWLLLLAQGERKREIIIDSGFNSVSPKNKRAAEKPADRYCRQCGFYFGPEIEEETGGEKRRNM